MKKETLLTMVKNAIDSVAPKPDRLDPEVEIYDPLSNSPSALFDAPQRIGNALHSNEYDGCYYFRWENEENAPQSATEEDLHDGIIEIDQMEYDELAYLLWAILLSIRE